MKKLATLALVALVSLTVSAQKVRTSEFSSVKVNVPVKIILMPGRDYTVRTISDNEQLASALNIDIRNGVLNLRSNDRESFEKSETPVSVIITSPRSVDYSLGNDLSVEDERSHRLPRWHMRRR